MPIPSLKEQFAALIAAPSVSCTQPGWDQSNRPVIELLAAWLDDEPLPLPRDVAEACHPNRFLLRKLIRGT